MSLGNHFSSQILIKKNQSSYHHFDSIKQARMTINSQYETSTKEEALSDECKQLLLTLPKVKGWRTPYLYQYQSFWCQPAEIQAIMSFQKHFQPKQNDIILATIPKSGTTWLKALTFAVVYRHIFPPSNNHPLITSNPHDLVPFFEYKLYANNQLPDFSNFFHEPRLFGTHVPFPSLVNYSNIGNKYSKCRIVYLCRNPFDTLISSFHFTNKIKPRSQADISLDEAFDMYCKGVIGFGPFWDHMLGYWKMSIEKPEEVLFLKYEDLKEDTVFHLKVLSKFLGFPFSQEEQRAGMIEKIVKLCSFENLKELEINKTGKSIKNFDNKNLFRKAQVGDWVNYFSPKMADKLAKVIEDKLSGSGLNFKLFITPN